MNEEDKIELKSEEFQEVLGAVPSWILRWGITVLAVFLVILLIGSAIIKYPDVISAPIVLTGSTPPAAVVSHASGKLKELYVSDNQNVKTGDYLAVIDNPAKTEDILLLKNQLDTLSPPFPPLLWRGAGGEVGSLQQLYTSFLTTSFEYSEYNRLFFTRKRRR